MLRCEKGKCSLGTTPKCISYCLPLCTHSTWIKRDKTPLKVNGETNYMAAEGCVHIWSISIMALKMLFVAHLRYASRAAKEEDRKRTPIFPQTNDLKTVQKSACLYHQGSEREREKSSSSLFSTFRSQYKQHCFYSGSSVKNRESFKTQTSSKKDRSAYTFISFFERFRQQWRHEMSQGNEKNLQMAMHTKKKKRTSFPKSP